MDRDFTILAKAISDETRVRILRLLQDGELCVCQLMKILDMKQSTISKHLGILKNAGLIENRKKGRWAFYRLLKKNNSHNQAFLRLLSSSLKNDPTVVSDRKALKKQKKKDVKELCA